MQRLCLDFYLNYLTVNLSRVKCDKITFTTTKKLYHERKNTVKLYSCIFVFFKKINVTLNFPSEKHTTHNETCTSQNSNIISIHFHHSSLRHNYASLSNYFNKRQWQQITMSRRTILTNSEPSNNVCLFLSKWVIQPIDLFSFWLSDDLRSPKKGQFCPSLSLGKNSQDVFFFIYRRWNTMTIVTVNTVIQV